MSQEFERAESSEVLPQNFGDLSDESGARIAERASKRLEITRGTKNPYWKGVEETLEGMAGWIRAKAGELEGKTIRAVAGVALVAELVSACSPAVSPKPIETTKPDKPVATETFIPTKTATATSTSTPEPTATPELKQFNICKLDLDSLRNCQITENDLFGPYWYWLNSLPVKFDESKVKDLSFYFWPDLYGQGKSVIAPNIYNNPATGYNFSDPSTLPWQRNVTFAKLSMEVDGVTYPFIVKPIFFNDKVNHRAVPVITVDSFYTKAYKVTDKIVNNAAVNMWRQMAVTPILTSSSSAGRNYDDPIAKKTFDSYPDMQDRFERFRAGDLSALGVPGIVLLTIDDPGSIFR